MFFSQDIRIYDDQLFAFVSARFLNGRSVDFLITLCAKTSFFQTHHPALKQKTKTKFFLVAKQISFTERRGDFQERKTNRRTVDHFFT